MTRSRDPPFCDYLLPQKLMRRMTARGRLRMTSMIQRQIARRVDFRTAAVDRLEHGARRLVRLRAANGGGVRPAVMPVFTKPGFTVIVRSPCARNLWSRPSR